MALRPKLEYDIVGNDKSKAAFNSVRGSLGDLDRQARGLDALFKGFLAGGATVLLQQGARAVQRVVSEAAQIGEMADLAGVSAEAMQELEHAARATGVSFDAITDGLKEMQLRADEFALTGKGTAAEAFQRIGMSRDEVQERLQDPADMLQEIVERVGALDKAAQIRIFDELFGGSAGEQFVRFTRLGADGIADLRAEARDLGVVLEDDLIENARRLDAQFDTLQAQLGVHVKRAVLEGVDLFGDLADEIGKTESAIQDFVTSPSWRSFIDAMIGGNASELILGKDPDAGLPAGADRVANFGPFRSLPGLDSLNPSTFDPEEEERRKKAREEAARDAEREQERIDRVLASLEHEEAQLGRTAEEQAMYNALKAAGIDDTHEMAGAVQDAARSLFEEAEAQAEANRQASFFAGITADAMRDVIRDIDSAEDAALRLAEAFADAALEAALLGQGPLAGLFGTAPSGNNEVGGLLGSLFGGFFAEGGHLGAGKWGIAGESGPEIIRGPAEVVPMRGRGEAGSNSFTFAPVYNVRGSGEEIEQLRADMARDRADFRTNVISAVAEGQSRRVAALGRGR